MVNDYQSWLEMRANPRQSYLAQIALIWIALAALATGICTWAYLIAGWLGW